MNLSSSIAFTIFEDAPGYWFVLKEIETAAALSPETHRKECFKSKIAACRAALAVAVSLGAKELHLHGVGSTITIKRESKKKGVKPYIYWPASSTRLAPFVPIGKRG